LLIALLVGAGAIAAFTGFVYYFLPLRPEEYLQVQTFFPGMVLVATVIWMVWAHHICRPVAAYLGWQLGGKDIPDSDPRVAAAYRGAQSLPYRLAGARLAAWVAAAGVTALVPRAQIPTETDNPVLFFGAALVICVGAAPYEAIWHRETMRPVLVYMSSKHRIPPRAIRAPMSLRMKLLISFGGLVLFACGLSLFWGFIQYKTLATSYLARQAQLTLDWVRSEV